MKLSKIAKNAAIAGLIARDNNSCNCLCDEEERRQLRIAAFKVFSIYLAIGILIGIILKLFE